MERPRKRVRSTAKSGACAQSEAAKMKARAVSYKPFTSKELDMVLQSLQEAHESAALAPTPAHDRDRDRAATDRQRGAAIDWCGLRNFLRTQAHISHKDWDQTQRDADEMYALLGAPHNFSAIFDRVLRDGGWQPAARAAETRPTSQKPWVVLVTGTNGIRKTTSVYQPWFSRLLAGAISPAVPADELPSGSNSFFRQLDFMVATVACAQFRDLYAAAETSAEAEADDAGAGELCDAGLSAYAETKDAIFARHRKLAECVGVMLLQMARKKGMNLLLETSGRDIAMFDYVDRFFPDSEYRKLALNFEIDDIAFAESSVDARMRAEVEAGRAALRSGSVRALIAANAGGPYGSAALRGVQAASRKVWSSVYSGEVDAGKTWHKACVAVSGHTDPSRWCARAVPPRTAPAATEVFHFSRPPS